MIQTWEIIKISIPPVTCTDEAASGAVTGKREARSSHVTSDDVRRTSFKLLTEVMVTHCMSSIRVAGEVEFGTFPAVKTWDTFVGCQITCSLLRSLAVSGGFGGVWGLSGLENMLL